MQETGSGHPLRPDAFSWQLLKAQYAMDEEAEAVHLL